MRLLAGIKNVIRRVRINYLYHRLRSSAPLRIHGKIVIVAPHPDDEVFGCSGLIMRSVKNGMPPHIIIMTGGGASHMGCCDLPDKIIIEERRKLTLNALTILGIPREQIHFLNFPDGEIDCNDLETTNLQSILDELKPNHVFVPHRGEGWKDHICTARIVESMIPKSVDLWEYCVWVWYYNNWRFDWSDARQLEMTDDEHRSKLKAIDAYIRPTAPCGNPWSGVLPGIFVRANKKKREFYFGTK